VVAFRLVVGLILAAGVALAPPAASAWRSPGGGAGGHHGNGGGRPSGSHSFTHPHQGGSRHFARSFARPFFPAVAGPIYYYPPYYPQSVLSYDQPAYDSPVVSAPAPYYGTTAGYGPSQGGMISFAPSPPPPPPSAVPYPTMSPPAWGPMPAYPPPPPPSSMDGAAPGEPAPRRVSRVYRWTDADGVTHYTDRLDSVPPKFREE
jgi:hypothetical protein